TNSEIDTKGKILFVEDVGEYLYSIDRMFWNLKRSGKLKDLKGLIIGGFRIKKEEDPDSEFGMNLEEIDMEKVKEYNYPVCFNFPLGHKRDNFRINGGGEHELIVEPTGTELHSVLNMHMIIIPASLKKRDQIRVVCPAGFMEESKVLDCKLTLE